MPVVSEEEYFALLREAVIEAENELYEALVENCPGPHKPEQHLDRKAPWCDECGRDARGNMRKVSEDTRPLPEDVVGATMFYPRQTHDDGRECCYHQRLRMWVVVADMEMQCTREHPPEVWGHKHS